MKHTIFKNPITHKFAVIRLPSKFVEGDTIHVPPTARWFRTRKEALATLPDLFDQEENVPVDDRQH